MNSNKRVFRTPIGDQSSMEVAPQDGDRGMDLVFRRSTHGEILVRLSWDQAEKLGRDIAALITVRRNLKGTDHA